MIYYYLNFNEFFMIIFLVVKYSLFIYLKEELKNVNRCFIVIIEGVLIKVICSNIKGYFYLYLVVFNGFVY